MGCATRRSRRPRIAVAPDHWHKLSPLTLNENYSSDPVTVRAAHDWRRVCGVLVENAPCTIINLVVTPTTLLCNDAAQFGPSTLALWMMKYFSGR